MVIPAGFEFTNPASKRQQPHAIDRAITESAGFWGATLNIIDTAELLI
jgi:hypothetical protein